MLRLRLGFGLLGLVLIVPLAILVLRSLDALAREYELRHAAVASRVFDEAEGALAEFLLAEEARPGRHYRGAHDGALHGPRSPLAAPPREPFVLAYFEADRTGRIETPLAAASASLVDELQQAVARSAKNEEEAPEGELPGEARALDTADALAPGKADEQAPGTTRVVQNVTLGGREIDVRDQPEAKQAAEPRDARDRLSSYDALEELGRVAKVTRREQVEKRRKDGDGIASSAPFGDVSRPAAAPPVPESRAAGQEFAQARTEGMVAAEAEADDLAGAVADNSREMGAANASRGRNRAGAPAESSGPPLPSSPYATPSPARRSAPGGATLPSAPPSPDAMILPSRPSVPNAATSPSRPSAPDAATSQTFQSSPLPPSSPAAHLPERARRIAIAPSRLSGERIGPGRLLLYRTAIVDDGVPVRQGMLVDLAALARWLEERVLGDSALGQSMRLEFPGWTDEGEAGSAPPPADRFVYDHRFDAPFEALTMRLALAPLSDAGSATAIYWMALLLLLASTAGLFAVYRMAAVAVHFAERRSNFAASVSHELKTPLTAIRMYAEMLRDGMVSDEVKRGEYYATITSESERLSRLIDNVLEWSKLEKHQRELSLIGASVEAPLREVVRVLRPHAEARGFALALELEPGLPAARHDPDALQQILFNQIDNALKYAASAGRKRIDIRAERDGEGVAIRVRDYGPGVDPKHLPLIFDAFYRAEDEMTRKTKGTGIGLALVRGLAEAMGGRASACNVPGGGFECTLWLAAVPEGDGRR